MRFLSNSKTERRISPAYLFLHTLSDISHGIVLEMNQLHRYHTPARKALDKLLRSTDSLGLSMIGSPNRDLIFSTTSGLIATSAIMGSFPQTESMT